VTAEIPTDTDAPAAMPQDPEIRESLGVILANAPALAAPVSTSSALLPRGPGLSDNINDVLARLRETGEAALEADRVAKCRQGDSGGVFSPVWQLKNADVHETPSLLLAFAKVFGARRRSG